MALAKLQFGPYLLSFTQSTYNAAQTLALIFIIMGIVLVLLTLAGPLRALAPTLVLRVAEALVLLSGKNFFNGVGCCSLEVEMG